MIAGFDDRQTNDQEESSEMGGGSRAKGVVGIGLAAGLLSTLAFSRFCDSNGSPENSPSNSALRSAESADPEQGRGDHVSVAEEPRMMLQREELSDPEPELDPEKQLAELLEQWFDAQDNWGSVSEFELMQIAGEIADLYQSLGKTEKEAEFRFEELRLASEAELPVANDRIRLFLCASLKTTSMPHDINDNLSFVLSDERLSEFQNEFPELVDHLKFFKEARYQGVEDYDALLTRGLSLLRLGLSDEYDTDTHSALRSSLASSLLQLMSSAEQGDRQDALQAVEVVKSIASEAGILPESRERLWLQVESVYGKEGMSSSFPLAQQRAVDSTFEALRLRLEIGDLNDSVLDGYTSRIGRWKADEPFHQDNLIRLRSMMSAYADGTAENDFLRNLEAALR